MILSRMSPYTEIISYLCIFILQVRHVTHEVRTPLNTVAIGADVLTHEVKQLGDLIPPVMMELVVGIKEASAGEHIIPYYHILSCLVLSCSVLFTPTYPVLLFPYRSYYVQQYLFSSSFFILSL